MTKMIHLKFSLRACPPFPCTLGVAKQNGSQSFLYRRPYCRGCAWGPVQSACPLSRYSSSSSWAYVGWKLNVHIHRYSYWYCSKWFWEQFWLEGWPVQVNPSGTVPDLVTWSRDTTLCEVQIMWDEVAATRLHISLHCRPAYTMAQKTRQGKPHRQPCSGRSLSSPATKMSLRWSLIACQ